jgi:hypothetical protein
VQFLGDRVCVPPVGVGLGERELQLDREADLQLAQPLPRVGGDADLDPLR